MTRLTVVMNDLPGGSETFLGSFLQALDDLCLEVTLLAMAPTRPAVGLPASVHVETRHIGAGGRPSALALGRMLARHPGALAETGRRLRDGRRRLRPRAGAWASLLRATRPDIVHFTFSGLAVAFGSALPLLGGVRLVTSCRGSAELVRPVLDPDRARDLGRVFDRLDAVHVVSDAMAATVLALGARPERIGVVRPAVDLERFAPVPLPDRPGFHIVAVGRLVPDKGHDDLVSALALARADGIDARLTVIGEGPHRDALRIRAHVLGLADHVTLRGSQAPAEVRRLLADADVVASASLSEGISNATLEAMAVARPVVVTDVGGMAEVITDGRDGLLVPPGDPSTLAAALTMLARDPARRVALARAGRARVEAAFGADRQRRDWASFYAHHLGVGDRLVGVDR